MIIEIGFLFPTNSEDLDVLLMYMPMLACCVSLSCLTLCSPINCSLPGSSVHGNFPDKNTRVGCHSLRHGIIPTQGSNPVSCIVGGFFTEPPAKYVLISVCFCALEKNVIQIAEKFSLKSLFFP